MTRTVTDMRWDMRRKMLIVSVAIDYEVVVTTKSFRLDEDAVTAASVIAGRDTWDERDVLTVLDATYPMEGVVSTLA